MAERDHCVLFLAALGTTLESLVAPVSRALAPHGFRRVAVAGRGTVPLSLQKSFDEVYEITPFRREGVRTVARAGRDLTRIVRSERPRLLHLNTPYGIALGRVVARATRTPHLAVVHGTLFGSQDRAGRLFSTVESAMSRLTPAYVAANRDDQETYRRLAPRAQVRLAPCGGAGIDPLRLRPNGRVRLPRQGRPPRALVLARLTPDKNIGLAVEAWRLARRCVPDLELRIVGSTADGEPAWHPPEEPGITRAGWTAEPGAEFEAADVVLSTSLREGFGLAVAESLMMGTPVVAVDNRGIRAVADGAMEGIVLVPPRAAAVSAALLAQLRARTVRLRPETLNNWRQDHVAAFYTELILDLVRAEKP
ncbi:glycosyltransferase [Micromonospora sp. KC606]|uniref:glycosyltransferase n=1 Tax=Micromonospora sp. KC606 TaxID=2530379 RepID=UPI0014048D59|nr:glycosyltransferase [Micromonospora sp. KC606]